MITPWVFEFANAAPLPGEPRYDWYLDLWRQAEEIGFEGIFFSEHHFRGQAATPSPHLLVAATAMRTSRLRLGVMGSVLPLHTPWRVAEEIGMLDHLTHGRLEIGYSSGIGPMETTMAGIAIEEVRPRFDEAIEIIEKALLGEAFSHDGKFWKFNRLAALPYPIHPLRARWMTVLGAGSAASAAARGFKICTGFLSVPEVKEVFDAYREAAGGPCPDRLGLRRQVLIADSDATAREIVAAAEDAMRQAMAGLRPDRALLVPDAPGKERGPSPLDFMFRTDEMICGTPGSVAEQIIEQCRATGTGNILAFMFGTIARADVERNYRLWREVVPVLRKARIN